MTRAPILSVLLAGLLCGGAAAAESGWDERVTRAFSERLRAIDRELDTLRPRLAALPPIPLDDQGGTGGFACLVSKADGRHPPSGLELRWPAPATIDLVALVPARRYDAAGLDAQYGLPVAFTVELLDKEGAVAGTVAAERDTRAQPVRRGHPFVYKISPPVSACGLRVSATQLVPDAESDGDLVHAWAEVYAFAGARNVALGAAVRPFGGMAPSSPWHWRAAFAVDGQTPLGLPELPEQGHGDVGWMSEGRATADESASVTVELAETATIDAVRLVPAKRPTSDLPSGFGFPQRIRVSTAPAAGGPWTELAARELHNPGHSPVSLALPPTAAKVVKVEAVKLWKAYDEYPAFFALSELEVFADGRNLALRRPVVSPDGMTNMIAASGAIWGNVALSDGYGPDGRLVPVADWLTALDERLRCETRCHDLTAESARLITGWRRAGLALLALLGVAGVLLAVVLPIRYRRHARRELVKVRERIAGDLHDEVGSNLGSIQMFADLAATRAGPSDELKRIQRIAGETVSAVRDIVWLLRPEGDHRIPTVEHLRETAAIMLEALKWKFHANEAAAGFELPDEATRHLFLFFREALHNILRHARATTVEIRADASPAGLVLTISDDGAGIDPERMARPATLHALRQRAEALHAQLAVVSAPDQGTRLTLTVPAPG